LDLLQQGIPLLDNLSKLSLRLLKFLDKVLLKGMLVLVVVKGSSHLPELLPELDDFLDGDVPLL
ncbi:hypothetical protein A2U01_0063921, partial [Trifolium medium]|nr:hypothetical protein [Trifolium medium]